MAVPGRGLRLAARCDGRGGNDLLPLPPLPRAPNFIPGESFASFLAKADRQLLETQAWLEVYNNRQQAAMPHNTARPPAPASAPLPDMAAPWPPVAASTPPAAARARAAAAEAAAAAAVSYASAAAGHEASAEAAQAAAEQQPAQAQARAGDEWLRASAAWRKAYEALEAARQAQPGSDAVLEAEEQVAATERFKHQRHALRG